MATRHSTEVREAAIALYIEEHPGVSRETAEEAVNDILKTLTKAEAEERYLRPQEPVLPGTRYDPRTAQEPTSDAVLPGTYTDKSEFLPALPDQGNLGETQTEEERAESEFLAAVEAAGVPVTDPNEIISAEQFEDLLRRYGADVDASEIQVVIAAAPAMSYERADGLAQALAVQYPSSAQTQFANVLELSGFGTLPVQLGVTTPSEVAGLPPEARVAGASYTRHPETGWLAYGEGVLANPDTGEVTWDPNSTAPGTSLWLKDVQETWGEEQVLDWRKRLHGYGYLSKDEVKATSVDARFLAQLQQYHLDRYTNFGKAIPTDLAGMAAADKPPLVNFEDFQAQTRNDVREEYRRVFGEDPTDGEVEVFSSMIIRKGMELQRKYRRKGYSNYSGLAATEAEERFIERLEQSPEAVFLNESEEENTRLRDALEQAVIVTNSLGG